MWPHPGGDWFLCGNFGLVLLNSAWATSSKVKDILESMVEVTMLRGAQTGGVVTFAPGRWHSGDMTSMTNMTGLRTRVVNKKRTTLSELLRQGLESTERWSFRRLPEFGRIYAGHTRFATSSKATFDGTHPHQWSSPQCLDMYIGWSEGCLKGKVPKNFEIFVTHNGDFDFFDVGGRTYELGAIQDWLERATGQKRPSGVDSAAIAGVMDLMRTQGSVLLSARFGFLFGVKRSTLHYEMPPQKTFQLLGALMDEVLQEYLHESAAGAGISLSSLEARQADLAQSYFTRIKTKGVPNLSLSDDDLLAMAHTAISAFLENDLLMATRLFMMKAKGSFGLCVMCSVDAHRQMVIAARGQTMSVAFYPETGLLLYASEQAAVKAALGIKPDNKMHQSSDLAERPKAASVKFARNCRPQQDLEEFMDLEASEAPMTSMSSMVDDGSAMRLDLDDLGGEVCLLDWGTGMPSACKSLRASTATFMPRGDAIRFQMFFSTFV